MSHEVTKTWEIDGKYHVKPSVGANKGKTLKTFNTEEAANKWAEQRSRNYKPKVNMSKSRKEPKYDSILQKMHGLQEEKAELDQMTKKALKKRAASKARTLFKEKVKPNLKSKSKGPVAVMPGSHKQNRMRY